MKKKDNEQVAAKKATQELEKYKRVLEKTVAILKGKCIVLKNVRDRERKRGQGNSKESGLYLGLYFALQMLKSRADNYGISLKGFDLTHYGDIEWESLKKGEQALFMEHWNAEKESFETAQNILLGILKERGLDKG
jgi:hypothetical protein